MRVKGVVFDLFGTLVHDEFSSIQYQGFLSELASDLSLRDEEFIPLWQGSYPGRTLGKFGTLEENFRWVGVQLGRSLDPSAVGRAATKIIELTRRALTPRDQALEVLRQLQLQGVKIGLLSDCGPAVPLIWDQTPFAGTMDATAFSCREGLKKPDPKFYRLILDRLGWGGAYFFYLGFGIRGLLEGARGMGMETALIKSLIAQGEPERWVLGDWKGNALTSLPGLASLLGIENSSPSFACKVCGMHFGDRETAEKCEAWCREHHSCNPEITRFSFERMGLQSPTN